MASGDPTEMVIQQHPFVLSRATESDLLEIIACEFRCFTEDVVRETFMGPDTPEGHAHLKEIYSRASRGDPGDVWLKVEEKATGKVVAASNWKIYPDSVPEHTEDMGWRWLERQPEKLARSKRIANEIVETRKRLFTEPYVQLHICYTDPDYQRKGIGSMMLKWGCDVADRLFLPAWVESSPMGNYLYRIFGFVDVEVLEGVDMQGSTMRRQPKITSLDGGKP